MNCLYCGVEMGEKFKVCRSCRSACLVCGGSHFANGLCSVHQARWNRSEQVDLRKFVAEAKKTLNLKCLLCGECNLIKCTGTVCKSCRGEQCSVCAENEFSASLCKSHYRQWKRTTIDLSEYISNYQTFGVPFGKRSCINCEVGFFPRYDREKYCSRECVNEAQLKLFKLRKKEKQKAQFQKLNKVINERDN